MSLLEPSRHLVDRVPGFGGAIGVARRDITPPEGIFVRIWGPATEDVSTGTHRPLTLTALAVVPDGAAPLVLIAADLGWWQDPADEWHVRGPVLQRLGLEPARVLVHLSHTHAGPSTYSGDAEQPGGHLVPPYLDAVRDAAVEAAEEALAGATPATLTWATGHCAVAGNRDLRDGGRHVVGYDPGAVADGTLLVGRVTDGEGRVRATLVNYACHPTTLAWQSTLVSPDFAGAMREVVEDATRGAPCLFLQGASGDQAPREQYVGDPAVADRHGAALGHAALGALGALPPPGTDLGLLGIVESGAPLAMWGPVPADPPRSARATRLDVPVELKDDLPSLEELERRWAGIDPRSRVERLRRARNLRACYRDGGQATHPLWVWSLGDCAIVAQPGELYAAFQRELRARFPERAIVVLNVTNAPGGVYLPPADLYDEDLYPVWQTLLARGSMERLLDAASAELAREPSS